MPLDLTLTVRTPPIRSRLHVARGALAGLGRRARRVARPAAALLVTDPLVDRLHGADARRALAAAGIAAATVRVPRGERAKQPRQLERLWRALAAAGLGRDGVVVALGGGVVLDLAGFAAASWMRGVPWIAVPTTLLAQVDASVGGKTAVDLGAGKNLVGAFHSPALVLADPAVLATLPRRQVRAGLAEVVKTGLAADAALFGWCERNAARLAAADPPALAEAVVRAVRAKARVVRRDPFEREGGGRTALNFGHTLGHAIEAALGYRGLLHGEAVAIGMRAALLLSERAAGLPPAARARAAALLDRLGLPRRMPPLPAARLAAALLRDKKRRGGEVRWVLLPRIGHASVPRSMADRDVRKALHEAGARG